MCDLPYMGIPMPFHDSYYRYGTHTFYLFGLLYLLDPAERLCVHMILISLKSFEYRYALLLYTVRSE